MVAILRLFLELLWVLLVLAVESASGDPMAQTGCGCPVENYECSCIDTTMYCIGMTSLPRFTSKQSCIDIQQIHIDTYYLERIESVPSDFFEPLSRYRDIKKLTIIGNNIRDLGSNVFPNMTIEELLIQSSHFSSLNRDTFNEVVTVKSLVLEHNDFTEIGNYSFENLQGNEKLSLRNAAKHSDGPLRIAPYAFNGGLFSTMILDLSENPGLIIESSPFELMPSLRHLTLKGSVGLQLTSQTFVGLHRVSILDLRRIGMTTLEPFMFQGMTYLEQLLLQGNPIEEIKSGSLDPLLNLQTLTLTLVEGFNQSLDTFYPLQTTIQNIVLQIDSTDVVLSNSFNPYQTLSNLTIDLMGKTTCPSITSDICATFRNILFLHVDKACEEITHICGFRRKFQELENFVEMKS